MFIHFELLRLDLLDFGFDFNAPFPRCFTILYCLHGLIVGMEIDEKLIGAACCKLDCRHLLELD